MNGCLVRVLIFMVIAAGCSTTRAGDTEDIRKIIHDGDTAALIAYLDSVRPNMNAPIGRGVTMLGEAANDNQPEIARILIEHGADVNAGDAADPPRVLWDGNTPLDHAAGLNAVPVAEVLIAHGADPNPHGAEHFGPLFFAATRGSEDVMRLLLKNGADPNHTDVNGDTPLLESADAGLDNMVKLLLEHGADLEAQAPHGANQTALGKALVRGHASTVSLLLAHHARCNYTDAVGQTTLYMAASNKWADEDEQIRVMEVLIQCGSDINAEVPQQGLPPQFTHTVLYQALRVGEQKVAAWLISQGAKVSEKFYGSDLRAAVSAIHDPHLLGQLLARGAEIDARDKAGITPYLAAVQSNNEDAVTFLLDHGIDANEHDNLGRNALNFLAENPHVDSSHLFATLLGKGVNPDSTTIPEFRSDPAGVSVTPLHEAAFNDQAALVQLLIEHGAKLNAPTQNNDTAYGIAALAEHFEIAQTLLHHGSSQNATDRPPSTVLNQAVGWHKSRVVAFLLEHHSNPDIADADQQKTSLHIAAEEGLTDILDYLLAAKANPAAVDRMGRTPLHLAVSSDHVEAADHLLAHGADIAVLDRRGFVPIDYARSERMMALLIQHDAKDPFHSTPQMDAHACESVASHANQGNLGDILGDSIDADDLKESPTDDWDRDGIRWVDSRFALVGENSGFLAGFTQDRLSYVARRSDDNVEKVVCEFTEGQPKAELVRSADSGLCSAVLEGRQKYPNYGDPVALDENSDTPMLFTTVGTNAALLDIENDRKKRWVVEIQFSSSHGAGCEETYPGVLSGSSWSG